MRALRKRGRNEKFLFRSRIKSQPSKSITLLNFKKEIGLVGTIINRNEASENRSEYWAVHVFREAKETL
jgi:hypothetical protein